MEKISKNEFLFNQPSFPKETTTDSYYLSLANKILVKLIDSGILSEWPEGVVKRVALYVIEYYQDVISDGGVWRGFINACRTLYSRDIPFFSGNENYIEYELNKEDVCFLVWYALAMNYEEKRVLYPLDKRIVESAALIYDELERHYDDSPVPEDFNITHGLKFNDPEDAEAIYHLGNWLFLHCYLMKGAYALTLGEILSDKELLKPDNAVMLQERLEQSMMEDPTGPLALFITEWLYLLVDGKMPAEKNSDKEESNENHPYYTKFTKATGGKIVKYFDSYSELNEFFISALGWTAGEEHLPQMKNEKNFVLMVNPKKGMLLAKNIAGNIADPDNPYYDKEYAKTHAIEMLTERGVCPGDLLKYVCDNGWLPDAVFPGTDDHQLVKENWDFIARCYLQQYYRGD